jgi:hypothetical protein
MDIESFLSVFVMSLIRFFRPRPDFSSFGDDAHKKRGGDLQLRSIASFFFSKPDRSTLRNPIRIIVWHKIAAIGASFHTLFYFPLDWGF